MTSPLEMPPGLRVERSVTYRERVVPARAVQVGAEVFLPDAAQRRYLEHLLRQNPAEMDAQRAAKDAGCEALLAEWRLQPGFVKWVETYLDAGARLDMAVLRRAVLARAIEELASLDPEMKPKALPLVGKLWPAAKLGKQGDEGIRVSMSATEVFKRLREAQPVESSSETGELEASGTRRYPMGYPMGDPTVESSSETGELADEG